MPHTRLYEAHDTLVKNRGKLQKKHPWATIEPYASELEDEPSYKFVSETDHSCWFDHFTGFEATYKLSRYSDLVAEAWETDTPLSEPVKLSFGKYGNESCTYCGQSEFLTDGFKIWAETPCPYPEGIPCEIILDVLSGKVVIGNDFRNVFPGATDQEGPEFYVNASYGIHGTIKDHEADKMAHFFVGNSSPDVYKTGEDTLMIANPPSEDKEIIVPTGVAEYVDNPEYDEWLKDKQDLGGVCTDLWWVSMVDGDEAVKRGMDINPESGPGWTEYVHFDCTPGRYAITYNGMMKSFNRDESPAIYATMRRLGDIPTA